MTLLSRRFSKGGESGWRNSSGVRGTNPRRNAAIPGGLWIAAMETMPHVRPAIVNATPSLVPPVAHRLKGRGMRELDPEDLPLISHDVLDALELEVENPEAYANYVAKNLEMWPGRYQRLSDAIREADQVAAMDAILSLRTASQMVGAVELADLALRVESTLRQGALSEAEDLLEQLKDCGNSTMERLAKEFESRVPLLFDETDWRLLAGQHIEVHFPNGIRDQGIVDAVTTDGLILWLQQDGATPRRLIEKLPGLGIRTLLPNE